MNPGSSRKHCPDVNPEWELAPLLLTSKTIEQAGAWQFDLHFRVIVLVARGTLFDRFTAGSA